MSQWRKGLNARRAVTGDPEHGNSLRSGLKFAMHWRRNSVSAPRSGLRAELRPSDASAGSRFHSFHAVWQCRLWHHQAVFARDPVAARTRSPATVGKHGFWSIRSIRRPCRQPDQDKAIDYNRVGEFERLRCQELVKFSGLQRPSLFIRNYYMPSLAGPNARLGNRYEHADPLAAYFLVLSCRYNLICQLASSSIRTPPRHLVLPLWLQFAAKVTI